MKWRVIVLVLVGMGAGCGTDAVAGNDAGVVVDAGLVDGGGDDAGRDAGLDAGPPPCAAWALESGCAEGERCLPGVVLADEGTCASPGAGGEGEPCETSEACGADLICGSTGVCRPACETGAIDNQPGARCLSSLLCVPLDPSIPAGGAGWCAPHCTPYDDRCGRGEWCAPIDAYYELGGASLENYRLVGVCVEEGLRSVGEVCAQTGRPTPEARCGRELRCEEGRCIAICRPSGIGAPATSCRREDLCLNPSLRFRDLGTCHAPCDIASPSCEDGFECRAAATAPDNESDYCHPPD